MTRNEKSRLQLSHMGFLSLSLRITESRSSTPRWWKQRRLWALLAAPQDAEKSKTEKLQHSTLNNVQAKIFNRTNQVEKYILFLLD